MPQVVIPTDSAASDAAQSDNKTTASASAAERSRSRLVPAQPSSQVVIARRRSRVHMR